MKRIGNGYWHFENCPFGHVTRVSENQLRVLQFRDCDLKRAPKRAEAAAAFVGRCRPPNPVRQGGRNTGQDHSRSAQEKLYCEPSPFAHVMNFWATDLPS